LGHVVLDNRHGLCEYLCHRGKRVDWMFTFAAVAYNLVRLRTLGAVA
jgi:hypothetical protein